MELSPPQLVILADAPEALCLLFGISLLERLLRVVQRVGFHETVILSSSEKEVAAHLAKPSWARAEVALSFQSCKRGAVQVGDLATDADRVLVVSAGFYYDARLFRALSEQSTTTLLVDSAPPRECAQLWQAEGRASARPGETRPDRSENDAGLGLATASPTEWKIAAALLDRSWLSRQDRAVSVADQLSSDARAGRIALCDAARQPTYLISLCKDVRPVFFPAPSCELRPIAEGFVRDRAQNGVLDFPGQMDSPIEDWIVARLCRTAVTPNQITFATMLIGVGVALLFATGHLWWGVMLACAIGVLDGVDGKLARTKVETTATGEWEHVVDYCVELSWWAALASHFRAENLRSAYWLLLLLVGSDLVDRLAKRAVKKKVGRSLDDVSNFDRFVRCIGGRRNINIWILIAALALGDAASGFVLFCWWGLATAAAHVVRALEIRYGRPVA